MLLGGSDVQQQDHVFIGYEVKPLSHCHMHFPSASYCTTHRHRMVFLSHHFTSPRGNVFATVRSTLRYVQRRAKTFQTTCRCTALVSASFRTQRACEYARRQKPHCQVMPSAPDRMSKADVGLRIVVHGSSQNRVPSVTLHPSKQCFLTE